MQRLHTIQFICNGTNQVTWSNTCDFIMLVSDLSVGLSDASAVILKLSLLSK
jgi:hypothetical protein